MREKKKKKKKVRNRRRARGLSLLTKRNLSGVLREKRSRDMWGSIGNDESFVNCGAILSLSLALSFVRSFVWSLMLRASGGMTPPSGLIIDFGPLFFLNFFYSRFSFFFRTGYVLSNRLLSGSFLMIINWALGNKEKLYRDCNAESALCSFLKVFFFCLLWNNNNSWPTRGR